MKEIKLTQNQVALVDDADYKWLMQWKWCAHWARYTKSFYAERHIRLSDGKKTPLQMHRQILGLERGNELQGDHKNHDTLDNRRENLRIVTGSENQWNRKKSPKGYCWHKHDKKYVASIRVGGVSKSLGYFDVPAEAHQAYLDAKKIYHQIRQSVEPVAKCQTHLK
jgi:hypothetical protein